jgi:activator of HSP90 ATPase
MESFEISHEFTVKPEIIYKAWLDSTMHGDMIDASAEIDPFVGGKFTAWDEYISGTTTELIPGKKIIQNWRTTEFSDKIKDSLLEIELEPTQKGTKLILKHSKIPKGQGESYKQGWEDHYFKPMEKYFKKFNKK